MIDSSGTGSGTLIVTADNTYTGGTYLASGTLAINADAALRATAGALAFGGGTLQALSDLTLDPSRRSSRPTTRPSRPLSTPTAIRWPCPVSSPELAA